MLAVALDQTYDYLVPDGLELEPGCFVLVPFGPQSRIGVVWDKPVGEPGKPVDPKKLKTITGAPRRAAAAGASRCALPSGSPTTRWPRSAWWCA